MGRALRKQQKRRAKKAAKTKQICGVENYDELDICPTPHICGKAKHHLGKHGDCIALKLEGTCTKTWD